MLGEEIMDRAFQDPGQGIEVGDIVVRLGLLGFHLGDETVGEIELEREIGLGNTPFQPDTLNGMDHKPVQCRFFLTGFFEGLLAGFTGCFIPNQG